MQTKKQTKTIILMASYKEYECEGCGYTVAANPKGKDMVMMGEVYNYLCPDC